MGFLSTRLHRFNEYFDAHKVPDRDAHELDRERQRAILCGVIAAVWAILRNWSDRLRYDLWMLPTAPNTELVARAGITSINSGC